MQGSIISEEQRHGTCDTKLIVSPGNTVMWNKTHYKILLQTLSAVLIQLTWPTLETAGSDAGH